MKNAVLLLAAAACASAFAEIRAVTPVVPDAQWTKEWWMKRHLDKVGEAKAGGSRVVFLGDSITHFWESNGLRQWRRAFAGEPYGAFNLGFSGDRTEHVLWRIANGELDGYEAKIVCLMIGTNNAGHFPFADEPPADTIIGIRRVIAAIRAKQPTAKIVLTAIFPRGNDGADETRRRNEVVNKEIRTFADGKTVFWVDFRDQLMLADGTLPHEIFPDALHPGEYGYEVWAAAVKPYIDHALSDGLLPAPPNRFPDSLRPEDVRVHEMRAVCPLSRIGRETYGADNWWLDRLESKRNEIAASGGSFDLVLFGDSITHNWESKGAEVLAELRKAYSVLDLGYSGDCTENLVWRGLNGELDGYRAKCVALMIGTNNSGNNRDDPKCTVQGVRKVLDVIAAKQPEAVTLLMPIFPRGASKEDPARVANEQVNAGIRPFADGKKVVWLDFNEKFLDAQGDTKWIMPDRLHPNAEGYRIWRDALAPHLKAIVGR